MAALLSAKWRLQRKNTTSSGSRSEKFTTKFSVWSLIPAVDNVPGVRCMVECRRSLPPGNWQTDPARLLFISRAKIDLIITYFARYAGIQADHGINRLRYHAISGWQSL